jgi:hypothetical protein
MAEFQDQGQRRLIVVDLDPRWRFAELVRGLALDLLPRLADDRIAFRTLYGNAPPDTSPGGRDAVWGALWPRLYAEDRTSLIAELEEALDRVDQGQGRQLDVCVVLPGPSGAGTPSDDFDAAFAIWQEFIGVLRERGLEVNVGRFAFVRPAIQPLDWYSFAERVSILTRPADEGRVEPFERVFVLGQRAGARTHRIEMRQFLVLRACLDLIDAARDRQTPPDGASRAEDFIARRTLDLIDFEAATPPSSFSERLSVFITQEKGIASETPDAPGTEKDAETFTRQIDAILAKIKSFTAERTFGAPTSQSAANQSTGIEQLNATYWSRALEDSLNGEIRNLEERLTKWWTREMRGLYGVDDTGIYDPERRRLTFVHAVNGAELESLQRDLERLTLSPAGLSGVSQDQITAELQKIEQARNALRRSIAANRSTFAYGGADAHYEESMSDVLLKDFKGYSDFAKAMLETQLALRALVQKRYLALAFTYIAFSFATVVAYSYGDAQGRSFPFWDWWFELDRPTVPVLWFVSTLLLLVGLYEVVLKRKHKYDEARNNLETSARDLTANIRAWVDSVRRYTNDVLHVRFYDAVIDTIKQRRDPKTRERFTAVLGEIDPETQRRRPASLPEASARALYATAKDKAVQVPLAGWFQRVVPSLCANIEPKPGAPVTVHCRGPGARTDDAIYHAQGSAFIAEARLLVTELAAPAQPPPAREQELPQ